MAGGKIYETPPTYVGMMPSAMAGSLLKSREPTYETLRNPPYSIPMVGPSSETASMVGNLGATRLSISQSHDALLSPTRRSRSSRSTDTDQYPYLERRSPSPHYSRIRRPQQQQQQQQQSSTLPSSMRSSRRSQQYDAGGYSVIREAAPGTMAGTSFYSTGTGSGGSTLPKSFSMQQPTATAEQRSRSAAITVTGRSTSLLAMGHEYAEISKPGAGLGAGSNRKPIPPPISTIPSNRDGGRATGSTANRNSTQVASKSKALSSERTLSPPKYGRTVTGQSPTQEQPPLAAAVVQTSNAVGVSASGAERKSRDRTAPKGSKSTEVVAKVRDRSPSVVKPSPVQGESKGKSRGKEPGTGLAGRATTGSTRRREFVKSQQRQHQQQRAQQRHPADEECTDDEDDDEVFLSDQVYERPAYNNRSQPGTGSSSKESSTTLTSNAAATTIPPAAGGTTATQAASGSSSSGSGGAGQQQLQQHHRNADSASSNQPNRAGSAAVTAPASAAKPAQAFDFTLQPPTSSSSSSGTQPHSSTSPITNDGDGEAAGAMKTKSKQKPEPGAGGSTNSTTTTTAAATTSGNSKPAEAEELAVTQQQQQQQQSNESESLRSNAKAPAAPSQEAPVSGASSQHSITTTTTTSGSSSASANASKTTTIAGSSQPEVAGDTSSSAPAPGAAAAASASASASASSRRRDVGGVRSAASATASAVNNSRSKDQQQQQQPPPTGSSELPAGAAGAVTPDEGPPAVNSSIELQTQPPAEEHTNEADGNEPGDRVTGQDECDIIDFPLPELPVSSRQDPTSSDSFFTATDAEDGGGGAHEGEDDHDDDDDDDVEENDAAKAQALTQEKRSSSKKAGKRDDRGPTSREGQQQQEVAGANMHYRTSANGGKPTYLFGENLKKNEIFLNKSGWVQVSGQPAPGRPGPAAYQYGGVGGGGGIGGTSGIPEGAKVSRKYIEYDENRYAAAGRTGAVTGSKLEDLINRNDTRGKGIGPRGAGSQHLQQQQQQQQQQFQKVQRQDNVTILKIDPSASSSLNNRPACLSIKRNLADGSPPPVTPILSPPPAFQDSQQQHQQQQQQQQQQQSNKTRLGDIKPGTRIFLSVVDNENHNPKGMVFSRSFEYDRRLNRRPPEHDERGLERAYSAASGSTASGIAAAGGVGGTDAFSKSFDYDFGSPSSSGAAGATGTTPTQQKQPLKSSLIRRTRSPTFATLTGNSPNYLTKKEKPPTLSSPIFPKAIPGNSLTVNRAVLGYASSESLRKFDQNKSLDGGTVLGGHRSRRSQFSTKANSAPGLPYGFRSDSVGNQRLNSCDSGARSDYSNDDVDDDDDDDDEEISEDQSSSLALSYKSSTSYINQMKGRATFGTGSPNQSQSGLLSAGPIAGTHTLLKAQRSLTPERLYDNNDEYGSMRNLKKQRSLTPEKRSRTPDDRSKRKGDPSNSSQSSLVSRQSSGSRSSTLERQQLRYDEGFMRTSSRSSSSSSYSGRGGDENVPATSPSNSYRQRGQLRGNVRHQPVALGGDYKIRRSRSLQLSERSPSRQQMPVQQMPHKVVVRLGTMPPKERPAYATSSANIIGPGRAAKGATPLPQMLSHDSLMAGGLLYSRISPSSTLDRLRRETASNTLEVVDKSKSFDNNNYGLSSGSLTGVTGLPYEYAEFDKSKSFDDNLGHGPADRDKRTYVTNEKRSYSHDRVFGSTGTSSSNEYTGTSQSSASRQQRSPQTSLFGGLNRMYDPEIHRATMARSPVMMGASAGYRSSSAHHRGLVSRERSPVPGQGTGRYPPPTDLYLMRQQTPDSEYDSERLTPEYGVVASEGPIAAGPVTTFKEAELVKKFLYATKNKIQMHRESAGRTAVATPSSTLTTGTPSSGSCTASSCDFWPHCGVSSAGATTAGTTATTAVASAQLHQQQQQQQQSQQQQHQLVAIGDTPQQHQLPKSGSENCLGRKVKRTADSGGGSGSDCVVVGPRANGTGAGSGGSGVIVGIGGIGSVGSGGGGGARK
ncbi:uncharacterized protein LOC125955574 [Anopheles darlingi]|uniref:uncharacterized protein LOC125955574 n=1 Tax=Anopheles darlingi TaxID=43151 RepID=UPI0021003644|nr:uncharacterized protein LOC125955574 [Anopheles darlingi]